MLQRAATRSPVARHAVLFAQRAMGARHEAARNGSDQSMAIRWRCLERTVTWIAFAGRYAPPASSCDRS